MPSQKAYRGAVGSRRGARTLLRWGRWSGERKGLVTFELCLVTAQTGRIWGSQGWALFLQRPRGLALGIRKRALSPGPPAAGGWEGSSKV